MWNTFRLPYLGHISCSTEILSGNFTQLEEFKKIAFTQTRFLVIFLLLFLIYHFHKQLTIKKLILTCACVKRYYLNNVFKDLISRQSRILIKLSKLN